MKSAWVGTMFSMVVIVAGCNLRKDLPAGAYVGLPDAAGSEVARTSEGDGSSGLPSGSGGPSVADGSTTVGPGGIVATGSGGNSGPGVPPTGGTSTGSVSTGSSGDAQAGGADAAVDGPLLMRGLGEDCSFKTDCASGNCSDGVCCDAACADSCSACNLANFVGHCSPVTAGGIAPSPHPACPKMSASTCQQNGVCDGRGACQLFASGETCAGGACNATTAMSVTGSTCDGLGACKATPAVPCSPFKCKADGTACATTCVTDADCQGQPCVAGSCGKVANGNKCTAPVQCSSGNCVDGYCCDLACGGSCQACDLAGSTGKCTTLAANQTPRNGRAACAAGTCGSRCDGTSASCVFSLKGTSCGAASCTGGMAKAAVSCDGMGACPNAASTSCGGYICSGSACKTTCTADADCLGPTPYCSGGKCQAAKPLGRACTAGSECAMGNCVNGVCCGSTSCPTCQACNLATPGTCSNKPAAATDSACMTANCQIGTCNGSGACTPAADGAGCGTNRFCRNGTCGACTPNQPCQPPSNPCKTGTTSCATGSMMCSETGNVGIGTPCGAAASCNASSNTKTNAAVCNGSGTCAATTMSCANGCNAAKTDCLMCAAGQTACSGMCIDTTSNAAHCGTGCAPCGGATPVCLNSKCVGCTNNTNCGAGETCDTGSHTCACQKQSGSNIVTNGGFDKNVQGWTARGDGTTWSSLDADGCAGSGSASGRTSICTSITAGAIYSFGAKILSSEGCSLYAYTDTGCSNPWLNGVGGLIGGVISTPSAPWRSIATQFVTPADSGIQSMLIICSTSGGNLDQVYLSTGAASF